MTTQLTTNKYRLRNALAFINSFSTAVNTISGSITGTLTNGSNVVSSISSNTGVQLGQIVSANIAGVPSGTVVTGVNSTAVALSQNFTGSTGSATVNTYSSTTSGYYMFAGTSKPFAGGVVPEIYDMPKTTEFTAYNTMIFGKSITSSDVTLMIKAYPWTSGTVYDMYDDIDTNLSTKAFYVYTTNGIDTSNYYIFKCLFNNNGAESTSQPTYNDTGPSDTFYETADGYQWKYMYKITSAQFDKFATSEYIPLFEDPAVKAAAVSGAVDVIVPVYPNNAVAPFSGSGYNNYHSGNFSTSILDNNSTLTTLKLDGTASTITNFYRGCYLYVGGPGFSSTDRYKMITGHITNSTGTFISLDNNFVTVPTATNTYIISPSVLIIGDSNEPVTTKAIALVNASASNSIYKIQILDRGTNILSAAAFINTSPEAGVTNTATIRVIAGPQGGHGSNAAAELYSHYVGVSVKFANSEGNTIPTTNDYQTVGIIKDPLFANVVLTTSNSTGVYLVGERVTQSYANVTSTAYVAGLTPLRLTNATGTFVVSPDSNTALLVGATSLTTSEITSIQIGYQDKPFRTFDQRYTYNGTSVGIFQPNETVYYSNVAQSNAIFHSNNLLGTTLYVTGKQGPIFSQNSIVGQTSGAIFNINTIYDPDLVPESGDVLYLENFEAVNRSNTQSETVKLILQY